MPCLEYVVGIDLGTTNSALAYAELRADADPFAPANVQLLDIPQLVNPGEVRDEPLLPSFLYLPGAERFPGRLAGAPMGRESRHRSSAASRKSAASKTPAAWSLRRNPGSRIPAWTAPRPCYRSARPKAWRKSPRSKPAAAISSTCATPGTPRCPMRPSPQQQVLVTVPASFDAVARELTLEAAEQAGYGEHHPARRAASRLLRLDRAPPRLARARPCRRSDPGRRYRRRHHRFHADRGHRARWRAFARPRRRRRPYPARRRQYRSRACRRGIATARRERHAHR